MLIIVIIADLLDYYKMEKINTLLICGMLDDVYRYL